MADPADALGFGADRLDEYRARDHRGGRGPASRSGLQVLTIIGALVVGFMAAVAFDAGRNEALVQDQRSAELVELVREQRERVRDLSATLEELREQVSIKEQEAAARVPVLTEVVRAAELRAGVTPVTGPGVVVVLHDAPSGCTGAPYLCRVQDYDLQQAVNTLFAAGAEAVSLGPQRVIATTAIRSSGSQITANYRFLEAPYEIRAVGDPDALLDALRSDRLGAALEAAATGLRLEARAADEVDVPGLASVPDIRVAEPVRPPQPVVNP